MEYTDMFEDRDIIKMYEEKQRRKRFRTAIVVNIALVTLLLIAIYLK